jgi:uncharacterized phage protein (TIGR02220 family)
LILFLVIQEGEVMEGWIKLHRSVLSHRLYSEKRVFSKYEAWIDILLMANHKEQAIKIETNDILIERGSFITSIRKLSDQWKWSRTKVEAFLDDCYVHGEIEYKTEKRWTYITVLNYEKHQGNRVEITIKQEPTFKPTKKPTEKADLNTVNIGVSEQTEADLKSQLKSQQKSTNKKKDKEININTLSFINDIIAYLNQKAGTKYRVTVAKTKSLIQARMKEGFSLDDFKSVIDIKVSEWHGDEKMRRYLRPETLFGTKFESYLNQTPKQEVKNELPMFTLSQEDIEYYERLQ